MPAILLLMTTPTAEDARSIATVLVAERLAACCSLVPGVESVYRWKDAVEHATETLVLVKTEEHLFDALCQRVQELHPYEIPELVATPITHALPAYLAWVSESVLPSA